LLFGTVLPPLLQLSLLQFLLFPAGLLFLSALRIRSVIRAFAAVARGRSVLTRISHHLIEWSTFRRSAAVREAAAAARCERAAAGLRHSRDPIRCLSSLLRPLEFRLNQP